jgi:hypothetical protein
MTTIVPRNNRKLGFSHHPPPRKEMGTGAVNPATGGINCAHASAERASEDQPKEELGPGLIVPGKNRKGGRRFTCRAAGKTYKHRGCYEGAAIQDLPSAPYWVDPDPCPALAKSYKRQLKEKDTKGKTPDFRPEAEECRRTRTLIRKAKKIVKLLQADQSLKPVQPVPKDITCGTLRKNVRSMYAQELTLVQELSIKTSAMAEAQPCSFCKSLQVEQLVESYKKGRYQSVDVDREHLLAFEKAFAGNVPDRWNDRSGLYPYVPNGAGSINNQRSEGGNWNEEVFNESCRVVPVFTKGKWRTVTAYSSHNVSTLTPLHQSLYSHLKGRNWLLVGSPTDERLRYLQAGCSGAEWLSFDYVGATDNIKTAYVQRAVEILIAKGEGLSDDEVRCLRVVAQLRLGEEVATKGQPMGSPMSFPLLCLINKTIVDLALSELLSKGEIGFKEWTRHRCLINGDDLLTRSTSSGKLAEAVFNHGSRVGMESNWEKTLASPEYGEINSTVFKNCVRQKKTNVSALWMSAEVTDVLGYAHESCTTVKGFLKVVGNNASRLARQKIKTFHSLPWSFKESLLSDRRVKRALTSHPTSEPPKETNLFPVVPMPDGYDLTREEEATVTLERVRVIRSRRLYEGLAAEKRKNAKVRKSIGAEPDQKGRKRSGFLSILKPHRPPEENNVLLCFASAWKNKRMEELLAVEAGDVSHTYPSDLTRIELCLDLIKTFKDKRNESQAQTPSALRGVPFGNGAGFVSLTDAE